jgi:hypothetical protein
MVRRYARCCRAWSIASVAISTTAVRTRIGRRASECVACRGLSQRVMPSDFCPPMDPLPNTSDPDGICCQRRSTAKRWGIDSKVGPKLQVRSGPPKGWVGPGRGARLPDERLSLNNLTKPIPHSEKPAWTSGRIRTEIYGFNLKSSFFNKIQ